jgi:hypothetical protein
MLTRPVLARRAAGALVSGADSAKQLFVPVDTSKVAHGDANLCIEDFFAKL